MRLPDVVGFVEHRIQDLRFSLRQLLKHPGFAVTAIVMLALGLGANVAIFGFVDATLIRPLPYRDPSRLVAAFGTHPDSAQTQTLGAVSYLSFVDWRERTRAFSGIAAFDVRAGFTLTTSAGAERVPGSRVTSGFFQTLGVTPVLGRDFRRDEEGPSAPATVVLSHGAWRSRFGARPDVLGQTITLQGEPHVVIGVLPSGFHFPMAAHADFWATIRGPQACWEVRGCRSLVTVARLADDVSAESARTNLDTVIQQLRREYPDRNPEIAKLVPLREVMLGNVRPILLMLLSGAGLLLLIAGINVMSLLLARSDSRMREIAVRDALGAPSARLVLQFATEALVLVAAGGVSGLLLAAWGMRGLTSLLSADMISRMPYLQDIGMNGRLVAFAGAVCLLAAAVFALTPIARVSMSARSAGLKEGSRGSAGTTWGRLGASLVVVELAVAVILLAGAGLLGKSLYRLLHVDAGFDVASVTTVGVAPMPPAPAKSQPPAAPQTRTPRAGTQAGQPAGQTAGQPGGQSADSQPGALARLVADRVAALPGVEAIGYVDHLPLGNFAPSSVFWVMGRGEERQHREDWPQRRVSAGYFTALGARLLRGRYFTEDEVAATRPVIIINESAARRYFPGEDPIGQSIAFGGPPTSPNSSPARQIVGVVADIKEGPAESPAHAAAYIPFDQVGFNLVVRTSRAGQTAASPLPLPSLVAAVRDVRPDLLVNARTMTERMQQSPSTTLHRSTASLVGGFAALALLLSVVGLYGVVAYSVGLRTREIGVRMALGAERGSVYRLVLGEAAWLVGAGTMMGLICAVGAATLMRRLLFDVQSWDAPTLAATAVVLIVSALLASYIPARRAASVNPIEVLRAE